ncbi:serine/threonine-protein kinase [Mycobacterium helveticum]|uniref:non-specific serine/threonine protein kinase n=1 Tax=Mycobacterium helveticum TaxID=2592811 RepID=A0A557XT88_9MYCO|nr:serine/threonine-protein kinase [Mycobacterium helveticum]TVS85374.1 serine/threonine protein kinase [Mycobacterium helveticum]TVS89163.1 serine/threonine protein kinase [Mycobacterium helveticum]
MALLSGATFAGYLVARRLGSGATGTVYLAQDPRSSRWQALKVLSPELSRDGEFRRRFHAETPTASGLYHPHIVRVNDRAEFEGQLWVAMDYVDGINAAQLMAGRFPAVSPVGEALAVVNALAEALDYAHQRGLLHRNVKPANVFLTGRDEGEPRILLSDFGIAGPSAYAAPEQLPGSDIDGRADQYALAATAFHLLTGAPLAAGAPPRLSDQRPELARLDGVFARALAVRAADRFARCTDFADAANEQAGLGPGDRGPEAVLVADYPAHAWPESDDASGGVPAADAAGGARPVAGAWGGRPAGFSGGDPPATSPARATSTVPARRGLRKAVLRVVAVALVAGLVALGLVVGRKTQPAPGQGVGRTPSPSAAAGGTRTAAPPVPLDGTYSLDVERTKQTYNYVADPQPPDVTTWWAFRSSCEPQSCTATATRLDDARHLRALSPGAPLFLAYGDGRWQSSPVDVRFPCIGSDGLRQKQTATLVLTLQPQSRGDFSGEETLTVQTNECGQRSAVIRIPAVASPHGGVPPGVTVPDPAGVEPVPSGTPHP